MLYIYTYLSMRLLYVHTILVCLFVSFWEGGPVLLNVVEVLGLRVHGQA